MGGSVGSWARYWATSGRLQRDKGVPVARGKLQAVAVTWARTSGGKTPRRPTAGRVGQRVGGHPAFAPLAHLPITGAHLRRNLLVAALRMLRRVLNYPPTHDLRLRRFFGAYEFV